ncbi:MAG: adenylate kinase [Kurthia sp.]|nr:adenylate kinase [Candidatus Kurthia equi]
MHQRILIIGCSGSGKSTLSRQLQTLTNLPVVHLDRLFWLPNWEQKDRALFIEELTHELKQSRWIIDGNFDSTLELRLSYADLVIFLDYSRITCVKGVVKRYLRYRGTTREDMGDSCEEKLDWAFLKYVWTFNQHSKQNISKQLQHATVDSVVFKNRKQLNGWLKAYAQNGR